MRSSDIFLRSYRSFLVLNIFMFLKLQRLYGFCIYFPFFGKFHWHGFEVRSTLVSWWLTAPAVFAALVKTPSSCLSSIANKVAARWLHRPSTLAGQPGIALEMSPIGFIITWTVYTFFNQYIIFILFCKHLSNVDRFIKPVSFLNRLFGGQLLPNFDVFN